MAPQNTALVRVDVLKDFMETGRLPVKDGSKIVPIINQISPFFNMAVDEVDCHLPKHTSFATTHGREEYSRAWMRNGIIVGEILNDVKGDPMDNPEHAPVKGAIVQTFWPEHCKQGTDGVEFHPDLIRNNPKMFTLYKGTNINLDSYSGFYENDGQTRPLFANGKSLTQTLREEKIETLVFVGLAGDYCVGWNALDAVKDGFNAVVVRDATRSIALPIEGGGTTETARFDQMIKAGVIITESNRLQSVLAMK